jgi:hypothetical protein
MKGIECFNFIDLLFEKVIYGLEIEIKNQNKPQLKASVGSSQGKSDLDDPDVNNELSQSFSPDDINSQKKQNNKIVKKIEPNFPLTGDDELPVYYNNIEINLINYFSEYYKNFNKNRSFVRLLPFRIFREIMYIYFQNNVALLLRSFKEVIRNFDEFKCENEVLIKKMRTFNHEKIIISHFTPNKIFKYIDICLNKLIMTRTNLKGQNPNNMNLSFDDIYVFLKLNPQFLHSQLCFEEFMRTV